MIIRKGLLGLVALGFGLTLTTAVDADVSGKVYKDLPVDGNVLNTYGKKQANEQGVKDVTVKAYDNLGVVVDTDTTLADGSYSLITGASAEKYRLEFTAWPNYLRESIDADVVDGNNTAVQFVDNGSVDINFGLHDIDDYSDTNNPLYVNNLQSNGQSTNNTSQSLHTLSYNAEGLNSDFHTFSDVDENNLVQGGGPVPQDTIGIDQIGSAWGKAFQKDQKRLFVSSVLQRHIGFANSPADVYLVDYQNSNFATTMIGNFSLQGIIPDNGTGAIDLGTLNRTSGNSIYELHNTATPNEDRDAFDKVGKVSYGDIDFDQNTNTLWLVNLNQRALISVKASGDLASLTLPANVNQYHLNTADIPNAPDCTNGTLRPWALKMHAGKGYLGAVCDAQSGGDTDDLIAYVLSFDPANLGTGFTTEVTLPLNYDKPNINATEWSIWQSADNNNHFFDDWRRLFQPILSDIEFDEKDNMYLGLLDRYGLQGGFESFRPFADQSNSPEEATLSQGEIFRVCNTNGVYEVEGIGSCTATNYSDTVETALQEFFNDDSGDNTSESSLGTMALFKGSKELMLGVVDPHPDVIPGNNQPVYWMTQGVNTLSTVDGSITNWYSNVATTDSSDGYNGKASSMGDIELLTPPAPIEIGNRVWLDIDGDGIQDADEVGISGLEVSLYDSAGVLIDMATSNANGNYIFSNDNNGTTTSSHRYGLIELQANTAYEVRVLNVSGGSKQAVLANYAVTKNDIGEGTNLDTNDSDGITNGNNAIAAVTQADIPTIGANNHSLDFGFVPPVSIGSYVWEDDNGNGIQDSGESVVASGTVTLVDESGAQVATDVSGAAIAPIDLSTNADGKFFFDNLAPGKYKIQVTPPVGYIPTPTQTGSDDDDTENDSNINVGAAGLPVGTYESGLFTLSPSDELTEGSEVGDDQDDAAIATDDSGNMTVDFGFIQLASIGDTVWYDNNANGIQDGSETGVDTVKVYLLDSTGTRIPGKEATTNNVGFYEFTGLVPDMYSVEFDKTTLPASYLVSAKDQGSDDAKDSDADPVDGKTIQTMLSSGEHDPKWDMGIYQLASLGDTVWYDDNGNGIQDGSETGVGNVKVYLLDSAGVRIPGKEVTTDNAGFYAFSGLIPNTYSVEFDKTTLPANHVITAKDQGSDDAKDSDANPVDGKTPQTTLASGDHDPKLDMGIYQPVSLGDTVWYDNNANGIQDGGETGVVNVKVYLLDSTGTKIPGKMVTTNNIGFYEFVGLAPGTYSVEFDKATLPASHIITAKDQGSDDAKDSDANPVDGKTPQTILASGDNDPKLDMGIYKLASLGDTVWYDNNANGIQDGGETGVINVKVYLLDSAGVRISGKETTTNNIGFYEFTSLVPGTYSVEFDKATLPASHIITTKDQGSDDAKDSDANPGDGKTPQTTLASGDHDPKLDMGIYKLASLGDTVWYDNNANGIQDGGETGVINVKVYLLDSAGVRIPSKETTTNNVGFYEFIGLAPGTYSVEFDKATLPASYLISAKDQGSDDAKDSDANSADGKTSQAMLTSGTHDPKLDMGIYKVASLGDTVWYDDNVNGIQDGSETGVGNVKVYLLDSAGTKITGKLATTNNLGFYEFVGLIPGTYSVEFDKATLPANYIITAKDQGSDDAKDSDANPTDGKTSQTTLASGGHDPKLDMGIYKLASLGDKVWYDSNMNGMQDTGEAGVENVKVYLLDSAGARIANKETMTNSVGFYEFIGLAPGTYSVEFDKATLPVSYVITAKDQGADDAKDSDANPVNGKTSQTILGSNEHDPKLDMGIYKLASLGDTVWYDNNANGVQDGAETGVENVKVYLLDSAGVIIPNKETVTNSVGFYEFIGLAPGTYGVEFDKATLPVSYEITAKDQGGDDSKDSDADKTTGKTGTVTLATGESNTTLDAGIFKPASLGNYVWDDGNHDGIQDASESGVGGITVNLLDGSGNPVLDASNAPITTTTAADGSYIFDNLLPGTYSVSFTNLPLGYGFTTSNIGGDDTKDSDADITSGKTSSVTLSAGDNNTTLDAGISKPASLGNYVWIDKNKDGIQDADETGVAGVTVTLLDGSGNPVLDASNNPTTTTTVDDGSYIFENLVPGIYSVSFTNLPTGFDFTTQSQGGDPDKDSDADVTTGKTGNVTLIAGDKNTTLDAGLLALSGEIQIVKTVYGDDNSVIAHDKGVGCGTLRATSLAILVDQNKDKKVPVTYCFEVTNTGPTFLTEIEVTDETLGLDHSALTLLNGPAPAGLQPGASLLYYYEVDLEKSLDNSATVKGKPSDSGGTPIDGLDPVESENPSIAKVALVIDPPSAIKTVTPSGVAGMEWKMVWINDSGVNAPDVDIYDEVPEGTTFEAMPAGANVSASGVYCEARGTSTTTSCEFEAPSATYPRGRVVWHGIIASDPGLTTEATANNELVIRFISTLDDPDLLGQKIENQATSDWDYDKDGNVDVNVPTQTPNGNPTTVFSNIPETIPTLSEWALLMLMMMLGFVGFRHAKARGGVRF